MLPDVPLASDPSALALLEEDYRGFFREVFHPVPRMSLSEWADRYGYLSDGQKWDTSVVPYLREIMDAATDPTIRELVIQKPARQGYTEGVLGQKVAYNIHQDPAPTLVVQPTEGDAKDWSQKQLSPMLEANPHLVGRVAERRSRDSGNTILDKVYSGGSITIRGAHSPKGLRRHSARDVILDEVDGFNPTAKNEGDPVMLSTRANRTYPDRKTIMGSTPTLLHSSRIVAALKTSDWREYWVPCPHCGESQVFKWGGPEEPYGLKWEGTVECRTCRKEVEPEEEHCPTCRGEDFEITHLPETAAYLCEHCGSLIEEAEKPAIVERGTWVPRYPGRVVRGYAINGFISPFEGASWVNMVREFLKAKEDPSLFQVWWNQWLGEPWEERGEKPNAKGLETRAMAFVGPDGRRIEVPDGVGVLTSGVDVQHDRLELLVVGWGGEGKAWDIFHERVYGDPHRSDTWARLDFLLAREFTHEFGARMRISGTMVDSSDLTKVVYDFVRSRESRNIWASKGSSNPNPSEDPLKRPSRANADGVKLFSHGTYPLKEDLFNRLRIQTPGPRYLYLRRADSQWCNGFDGEFFAQFGAEQKVPKRIPGTRRHVHRFVQVRARNEAIDLHVLAHAALLALGAGVRDNLGAWADAARKNRLSQGPQRRARRVRSKGVAA